MCGLSMAFSLSRTLLCDDLSRVTKRAAERTTMGLIDDATVRERTKRTSAALFKGVRNEVGFEHWKRFDKTLARDLSLFFTGVLYSREVISQTQRELCAVASLTVLHRPKELHVHIHAALNVGATRQQVADGGMPVVVDALEVYGKVLAERGEPFPGEETT